MRILIVIIALTSSLLLRAQSFKPVSGDSSYLPHMQSRKWLVTSYSNIGIGLSFFNGTTATAVSAPVGLQLNRRLNDNLYAFTGIWLAPTYINFNRSFLSPAIKSYSGLKSDYVGVNPSVNLGLMYVNDARTFSVSGSIGVQRSSYPMLFYSPATMQRINSFTPTPAYR